MRHSGSILLCATLAGSFLATPGCKQSTPGTAPSASASAAAAPTVDPVQAFLADGKAPLTAEIEEKLLLGLSECKVDDNGIQPKCRGYVDFTRGRQHKPEARDVGAMLASIGKKHIADASPAVRLESAELIGPRADPATMKTVIDAARKEKVPGVLVAMLRVAGMRAKADPEAPKLLLEMTDNASPRVRMESMGWLLTAAGASVPGAFDKILDKVDKDPSLEVRKYLCTRLYRSDDERAMGVFEKYVKGKDTPPALYEGCFRGLISAWTGFPNPQKPLQKAYKLTLALLRETPRTKTRPPWSAISTLRAARTDFAPTDKAGTAWLEKVKPWYKKSELIAALAALAGDKNAHWMARTSALDVMKTIGASTADFKQVLAKYKDAKGEDLNVKRRVEALTKTPKKPPVSAPAPKIKTQK